jgi:hypothetical protein
MGSIVLDLWDFLFELSGFSLLLSFFLFALKVPIGMSCLEALKQRGETFQVPGMGMGIGGGFPSMGSGVGGYQRAEQGQGETSTSMTILLSLSCFTSTDESVWSMPGGLNPTPAAPSAPAQFPSSGGFRLGGEDDLPQSGGGPQPQPGRGGYQTID